MHAQPRRNPPRYLRTVAFIAHAEAHHVLIDRPAELPAELEILRLDLARTAAEFFERRRGAHALVGIVDEGFTVKFVGARARNGGDGDRTHLVELGLVVRRDDAIRSEEHTSELQSLMRISYAVFCLKKKKKTTKHI